MAAIVGGVVGSRIMSAATNVASNAVSSASSSTVIPGGSYNVTGSTDVSGSDSLFNTTVAPTSGTEALPTNQLNTVGAASPPAVGPTALSQGEIALAVMGSLIVLALLLLMIYLIFKAVQRNRANNAFRESTGVTNLDEQLLINQAERINCQIQDLNTRIDAQIAQLENMKTGQGFWEKRKIGKQQSHLETFKDKLIEYNNKLLSKYEKFTDLFASNNTARHTPDEKLDFMNEVKEYNKIITHLQKDINAASTNTSRLSSTINQRNNTGTTQMHSGTPSMSTQRPTTVASQRPIAFQPLIQVY
jgi:predicted negative regulator of RcsB-dependent stress response